MTPHVIPYCKICGGSFLDFGTHNNKVIVKMPEYWDTERPTRYFAVDSCMVPELSLLWNKGIRTIECCCGHSINKGYVAVDDASIENMESLGYTHCEDKPDRKDLFYPRLWEHIRNNL